MSETTKDSIGCTIGMAAFGALLTVIALVGAFAIADTPRQLTEVANAVASTDGFEIYTPSLTAVAEERTTPPATSDDADLGLQDVYSMFG